MKKVYLCAFRGAGPTGIYAWGGIITSYGVDRIVQRAAKMGIEGDAYNFNRIYDAGLELARKRQAGYDLTLLGYSLGNTAATWLQLYGKFKLVQCIAESTYAGSNNHPINHANVARSVLWRGTGALSNAGGDLGFTTINDFPGELHLWLDFNPRIVDGVLTELKALL